MTVFHSDSFCDTDGNGVQQPNTTLWGGARDGLPRFGLPADCSRILIVGAGGFGREVLQWARDAWPARSSLIGGFLSDDLYRLDGFSLGVRILSTVSEFRPSDGDYLILAIGVPYVRRRVTEQLLEIGSQFLTLVHPQAIVAKTASVGKGSVICPFAVVSESGKLGDFVLLNYYASIGHDAWAGDYSVLSPYATLGGGARVDCDVFLGVHASVGPGKRVGNRSKVSSNSCVLSDSGPDSIVYGVPGRVRPRIDIGVQ
jgi:sugar O-acyltransferase (sialic acid O-acetyltransferase NeuD family)